MEQTALDFVTEPSQPVSWETALPSERPLRRVSQRAFIAHVREHCHQVHYLFPDRFVVHDLVCSVSRLDLVWPFVYRLSPAMSAKDHQVFVVSVWRVFIARSS